MRCSHLLILFCLLIEANSIKKPKNSKKYNLNKNEFCLVEDFGSKIGLSKKKEEKYSTKNSLYDILSKSKAYSANFQNLMLLKPNKKCKISEPTVYFHTNYNSHKIINNPNEMSSLSITTNVIKDKAKYITVYVRMDVDVLVNVLKDAGLYVTLDRKEEFANLYFIPYLGDVLYYHNLDSYQILNKDTLSRFLYGKGTFIKLYNQFNKLYPEDYNFVPESYSFNTDKKYLQAKFADYQQTENDLWLEKPIFNWAGSGIKFFEGLDKCQMKNIALVKYISNPLLVHGKKFDFRIMVLVSEMNPLKIYLYNENYLKFTTEKYVLNKKTLSDKKIHLTNFSIHKHSKKFYIKGFDDEDGSLWSTTAFINYLKKKGINWNPIWDKIKDIFIKYFAMYTKGVIEREKKEGIKNRMFLLWGMDIILDSKYNPYLLEGNEDPGLDWNSKWADDVSQELLKDTFNIIGLRSVDRNDGSIYYKDRTFQEIIDESICEMTRPTGAYERIFPKIDNIDYYKKFIHPSEENLKLWEEMKNLNITP